MDQLYSFLDRALGLSTEPRDLDVVQVCLRGTVIFAAALVMLRLAHKRFFARRSALDVLLTLVIASTLARAINGNAAFFPAIVAGFALVLLHRVVSWVAARSSFVGGLVKGHTTVLIEEGDIRAEELRKHDLSRDDLNEDLRLNGVERPEQVRRATLERSGEVSVVRRREAGIAGSEV